MDKELNLIISTKGKELFRNPDQLMQELRQSGVPEKDVLTTGLILKTCVSVSNMLAQDDLSRAEINVMLTATCIATGLSACTVRYYLGMFLRACGIAEPWKPQMMTDEVKPDISLTPMVLEENETAEQLAQRLNQDAELSEEIRDLETLSKNGNIHASYALGKFFKPLDDKHKTIKGKVYFQRAANLGYGPANGALADYELREERKNIPQAAKYFENPGAITGKDGREWAKISDGLLQYREDNNLRVQKVLRMQLWIMALTGVLLTVFAYAAGPLWSILCAVAQLAGLGWTLYVKKVSPYSSCQYALYAVVLSWIFLIATLFII
ncbi:MAG: hypothetical protein IKM59_04070 [Oscillospiraceae bacterium]|nr:hypothetical protein [Oscillospiraceae bacterium]